MCEELYLRCTYIAIRLLTLVFCILATVCHWKACRTTESTSSCFPGWSTIHTRFVSLEPIFRSSSSHNFGSFDWAIVSIVICHLLVRLGTIDVQVDPDWGLSNHINNTSWIEFATKVSNWDSGSLITWYILVVEGIGEPIYNWRMYTYAEDIGNL